MYIICNFPYQHIPSYIGLLVWSGLVLSRLVLSCLVLVCTLSVISASYHNLSPLLVFNSAFSVFKAWTSCSRCKIRWRMSASLCKRIFFSRQCAEPRSTSNPTNTCTSLHIISYVLIQYVSYLVWPAAAAKQTYFSKYHRRPAKTYMK